MNQIDHIPNEKRPPKWLWKAAFAFIAAFWGLFWFDGYDWPQIMLGVGTGALIAGWAMEQTGGEVPASWRSKPPR